MHEDVAANVIEVIGHLLTIGAQRAGQVQPWIAAAHRLRVGGVAHQADGRARHAQANGHFRAYRNKIEMFAQDLVAQS
ncbi:hypothetical protein D3C77_552740 [compost metagenome]